MVELKSFEIFFELVKGKSVSTMLERSQGFSNWIRFTQRSLVALLVGMEDCYLKAIGKSFKERKKGDRSYRLELHNNGIDCFILCFICSMESMRLFLEE